MYILILPLTINETPEDQTAMMNKNFKAKMQITGYLKSTEYKDDSGANTPVLASGMIPVIYDATSDVWKVADIEKEWYNYDEQWWANAVTTSDASYRTSPAGTEIPMEDINSMWVWIPRYKYRIPSNIGSSSNVTSPPEIDVVFENGTSTTGASLEDCPIDATDCYYTHPAFRDGSSVYKITAYDQGGWDEELTGIWVGKFETGGSASMPLIKPDIQSLRNQTVYDQFVTSLKFAGGAKSGSAVTFSGNTTYGLTGSTDTHMMKNTEWGAVAYLSQSKYGKMGNPNYSGVNKEIYVNNSSYYTGRSGGSPASGSSSYGTYSYIGKTCSSATCTGSQNILSGTGASTTGTVYGIYDMSAGLYEYTMGNWEGTVWTAEYPTNILPGSKYYDIYTGTSNNSITSDKSIKGDATYETMRWYSDGAYFPYAINPWFYRGGGSHDTANIASNGVFNSNRGDDSQAIGSALPYVGFRTVLIP